MRKCVRHVLFLFLVAVTGMESATATVSLTDLGGDQYRATFTFKPPAGASTVYLAGNFNGWDPGRTKMDGPDEQGGFHLAIELSRGRYEYKFVVDGSQWCTDMENPHKSRGYLNALVYAGVEPDEDVAVEGAGGQGVRMASQLQLADPVKRFAAAMINAGGDSRHQLADAWFREHSMPLFSGQGVSFVYVDAQVSGVFLDIASHGVRTGYRLPQIAPEAGVWAITLNRSDLGDRWAYWLRVRSENGETTVVDPHAWSVTSRGGRPATWGIEADPRRGRIEVIEQLKDPTGRVLPRDVYVYLPPGYDEHSDRQYPVLYMHDGQNCWDDPVEPFGHGGWSVNLVADRMIGEGSIDAFIAVGMANTAARSSDYGPGKNILSDSDHGYIQLIKRVIKPRIDRDYRTLADARHTALMGSSMGGIISLQASILNPDIFGQAACLSPAFFFTDSAGKGYSDLLKQITKRPVRLYLDSGTAGQGQDGAPQTREMVALLHSLGWRDGDDLAHFEDAGAMHTEEAWRARLHRPLSFLFGKH